ncbi:MAG: OmpA/MotB family protein [Planctomycetota bacterium]|jgi:outer membrane protein OmpA-like peptidoglycan-associated protein
MRVSPITTCGMVAALIAATGCTTLQDEVALLRQENEALRSELSQANTALGTAHEESRQRGLLLADLRQEMDGMKQAPGLTGFEGIEGVTGKVGVGEVTAMIESDILFDSGKATLKKGAKQTLGAVASVLNTSYAGKEIRIAGHTDTDPIRKSGHASNHHLGFERAFAVRQHLVSNGVTESRMYLASYGPDQPRTTKAASRRVEIVVLLN